MKILVTSTPDLIRINPQRPHHLLSYLSQNHDITALCVNAWWLGGSYNSYSRELLNDIELSYITKKNLNPVFQEILVSKKLKELTGFDVHINFNSLMAGYLVSKRTEIPTVFDICDDLPQRIRTSPRVPYLLRPLSKLVGQFMLKQNINLAKTITCVTESLCHSYHLPQNRSKIIPNGINTQLFHDLESQVLRRELGIDGYFVVGFVGVLSEWVELEPALAALKKIREMIPKIKMLIVGGGDRLQKLRELVRKYNISDEVILTDYIQYTQVPAYISCMDCCLISLKATEDCQNAFPMTLLEYMSCEKPVISTPLTGVKETVGDRVLYALSVEEIGQRIFELYHDEESRVRLGRENRAFVEQNYSWKKICAKFEAVILEASNKAKVSG